MPSCSDQSEVDPVSRAAVLAAFVCGLSFAPAIAVAQDVPRAVLPWLLKKDAPGRGEEGTAEREASAEIEVGEAAEHNTPLSTNVPAEEAPESRNVRTLFGSTFPEQNPQDAALVDSSRNTTTETTLASGPLDTFIVERDTDSTGSLSTSFPAAQIRLETESLPAIILPGQSAGQNAQTALLAAPGTGHNTSAAVPSAGLSWKALLQGADPDFPAVLSEIDLTEYPAANRLMIRFLGEDFGAAEEQALTLASFGAHKEAGALMAKVHPRSLTRAAMHLLAGEDDQACALATRARVESETGLADRESRNWSALHTFCLARRGDPLAHLLLRALRDRQAIEENAAHLIEAMLDPGLAAYLSMPEQADLTPLQIAALRHMNLFDATHYVGAPMTVLAALPRPQDAHEAVLWQEALVRAGLAPASELLRAYNPLETTKRGGPWSRAVSARTAQLAPDAGRMGVALEAAFADSPSGGIIFARALVPLAAKLQPLANPQNDVLLRNAFLLAGDVAAARAWHNAAGVYDPRGAALIALAAKEPFAADAPPEFHDLASALKADAPAPTLSSLLRSLSGTSPQSLGDLAAKLVQVGLADDVYSLALEVLIAHKPGQ